MTELAWIAVVVLQAGILVILLEAIRRRNVPAVVNALASFALVLLPILLEFLLRVGFARSVGFGPELPFWIAMAGLIHSFGMLGPYDSIWWWDHLTHTLSAALVAALIYAGLVVASRHTSAFATSIETIALLTVVFTLAIGIFWEIVELFAREVGKRYDVDPVLVHYGWRDTALDLVFDVVGALSIVVLDVRLFVPIAERFPRATVQLLQATGIVLVVGSALMLLALHVGLDRGSRS